MGTSCCNNYQNESKEDELFLPQKIKYNLHEINKMLNFQYNNNDFIMTSINDQDKISTSSQGFGFEKKFESIDSSHNIENKYQRNNNTTKHSFLGQIKEKDQKYEQDQEENSNKEGFCEIEKISVNQLITDIDNIYKNQTNIGRNKNKNKNNTKKSEKTDIKRVNQVNLKPQTKEEYNKMNHYNIDNDMQWKIKGDYSIDDKFDVFENDNDKENNKGNRFEDIKIQSNEITEGNENNKNTNNENIELYKIEINDIINNNNKNNDNKNIEELYLDDKQFFDNKRGDMSQYRKTSNENQVINDSLSEFEKKDYRNYIDSFNEGSRRASLYHKKKIKRLTIDDLRKSNEI